MNSSMPRLLLFFSILLVVNAALGWQAPVVGFTGKQLVSSRQNHPAGAAGLTMRDASASYWFKVGDNVRVVDDVYKAKVNLRKSYGKVVETWEKCDVDPTCCCAEQVDIGMAVRVEFQRKTGTNNNERLQQVFDGEESDSFMHYFAEEELVKVSEEEVEAKPLPEENNLPFDGISCTAFKLGQLEGHQKARGIASFEPVRANKATENESFP